MAERLRAPNLSSGMSGVSVQQSVGSNPDRDTLSKTQLKLFASLHPYLLYRQYTELEGLKLNHSSEMGEAAYSLAVLSTGFKLWCF